MNRISAYLLLGITLLLGCNSGGDASHAGSADLAQATTGILNGAASDDATSERNAISGLTLDVEVVSRPADNAERVTGLVRILVRDSAKRIVQRLEHATDAGALENPGYVPEVLVDDVNFDGHPDFNVHVSDGGAYGSQTFAFFLFDAVRGKFVHSAELTKLSAESLGFYELQKLARRIQFFHKSGCCIHATHEYAWENGIPALVRVEETDATSQSDCTMTRKERRADGLWDVSRHRC